DLGDENETPREKPASIESSLEGSFADEPPTENGERVLDGVCERGEAEFSGETGPANVGRHARAGRGTQYEADLDAISGEALAEQDPSRRPASDRGNARFVEDGVDLGRDRRFELRRESVA